MRIMSWQGFMKYVHYPKYNSNELLFSTQNYTISNSRQVVNIEQKNKLLLMPKNLFIMFTFPSRRYNINLRLNSENFKQWNTNQYKWMPKLQWQILSVFL